MQQWKKNGYSDVFKLRVQICMGAVEMRSCVSL